jgi:phosphatidylinositol dimannoside acyltransferase
MLSRSAVLQALRPDSLLWRRAILFGVNRAPDAWIRYSPPVFGLAFAAALPETRERVRANLRRILGRRPAIDEIRDVAAVFTNYAFCLTEALLIGSERGYELTSRSVGVERYHACAAEGRGVIIATAHTGGWEVAGPVLSGVHEGEVVVVMQRERDERARALQDQARSRAGVKVVHIGDSAFDALTLLAHLRRKAVVAMQIDRVPPAMRSRTVRFFGEPWQVPEGPLTLAAVSGAPILPVFTRRLGFMEYEAVVAPPIRLPRRPSSAEMHGAAEQLMGAMADFVRENPTQWFHFV